VIKRRVTDSGNRYDVRLRGPDGKERSRSFRTLKDAQRHEREVRSSLDKGSWIDPRHASLTFDTYADQWIAERHELRPRTVELYKSLLRVHIRPDFGALPLGKITPSAVRSWNSSLAQRHPVTAAKAYRLLREMFSTAISDELIARNPCAVKGAGQERSSERPMVSVPEVAALAAAIALCNPRRASSRTQRSDEIVPERKERSQSLDSSLRIAVLLAAWCQCRRGELLGLERRDVDLLHGTVRIERTANHAPGGVVIGPPKSDAGIRTIVFPSNILDDLTSHLDQHVGTDPWSPLLAGSQGGRLRPSVLQAAWVDARASIGRPELHFHDLRHAGATWLAVSGATTRELMARVGHASPAAALRYQHATEDRDTALAQALAGLADTAPVVPFEGLPRDIRGMDSDGDSDSAAGNTS
jgi:integrase